MKQQLLQLVLIAALIVLNGVFAAAEMALVGARRAALKMAADEGSPGAKAALRLIEEPSRFLAAIQVGITLAGFMASATAAVSLAAVLEEWLLGLAIPWVEGIAAGTSVVAVTLAVAYVTLVFGELAPKRVGLAHAEALAQRVARPVTFLAKLAGPVTWVLSRSTEAVAGLMGAGSGRKHSVSEEEIKLLVAEQVGLLDEEKQMIHDVFKLGDTVVREIMVPRVDAVMIDEDSTAEEALAVFRRSGFSRLPVYREDPDTVAGILLLKDLLGKNQPGLPAVKEVMRAATFVPETKNALALMKEMQAARSAMVIVVDEYGGTAGLVTLEDIVEEVIGEIVDEFDEEERYITQLGEGDWIVDGRCAVEDAGAALGIEFPESEEYETVAGWVLATLGHIPSPGESIEFGGAHVRVQTVRRRRIARLRVTRVRGDA